jgi:hypothetical protein
VIDVIFKFYAMANGLACGKKVFSYKGSKTRRKMLLPLAQVFRQLAEDLRQREALKLQIQQCN